MPARTRVFGWPGLAGRISAIVVLGAIASASPAAAQSEPWSDYYGLLADAPRLPVGDYGLTLGAQYRATGSYLSSQDLGKGHPSFLTHRIRLDVGADYLETVRFVMGADLLDGVLWGDNGTFDQPAAPSAATTLDPRSPNLATVAVGYRGRGDRLDPRSYGLVLEAGAPLRVRRAYGEIATPIGVLRVGRQPTAEGTTLLYASGDGLANRFGEDQGGDSVDRVRLTTHPDRPFQTEAQRDDRGLSVAAYYDRLVTDLPQRWADDANRGGAVIRYLLPRPTLRQSIDVTGSASLAGSDSHSTLVGVLGAGAVISVAELTVGGEWVFVDGSTREIGQAYALITGVPPGRQRLRQWGTRLVARWDDRLWSAYLEYDYASGDADPDPRSRLTSLAFSPDANVGLLLFEQVLAYATARGAAAGSELLVSLGASPDPALRLDSRGAFTNAAAIFPQLDLRPLESLLLRGGVLVAWTPDPLIDPIQSLRRQVNGESPVNYHGGAPGRFYGVELDSRVQYHFREHFFANLEAALLLPGDALENAEAEADTAALVQLRAVFAF